MSNSTTTRTPRSRACSTTAATSECEYVARREYAPFQSAFVVRLSNGKLGASTTCQCSTLSLLAAMASSVFRRSGTGMKCLAVSTRMPRQGKAGSSRT